MVARTKAAAEAIRAQRATETRIEAPGIWETDPARIQRIGILCGGTLYAFRHVDPRTASADDALLPVEQSWELAADYDLHELGEAAFFNKMGAIWLVPVRGARPSHEDHPLVQCFAPAASAQLARADRLMVWHPLTSGRPASLVGLVTQWKRGDGSGTGVGLPVGVYAPWMGDKGGAWGFGGALGSLPARPESRARIVATALALAAYTLRQQLRFSPGYTGGQLLRTVIAHKQERIPIPALSPEWRERLLDLLPHPLQWARPVDETEVLRHDGSAVIFKFDRTASYPASAGEVPCGDPEPTPFYAPRQPGVYHVTALAPQHWFAGRLPGLFYDPEHGTYPTRAVNAIAWEPQIRLAERLGWQVIVHGGYTWPRERVHDLFRPWREQMFAARLACAREGVPGRLAARIVKLASQATIGRLIAGRGEQMMALDAALASGRTVLSYDVDNAGEFTGLVSVDADAAGKTDLFWPHAWATIIANANERLQHAICTVAPQDTIAAYVDALYTLRNHPELVGAPDGSVQLGRFRLDRVLLAKAHDLDAMRGQSAERWVKTAAHLTAIVGGEPADTEGGEEGPDDSPAA